MLARDLPQYVKYRKGVLSLRNTPQSLQEFSSQLKTDHNLTQLRNGARNELQSIYGEVQRELGLPHIPVYLPVKKKIYTRGQAHSIGCNPTQIRVYPIAGPDGIPYDCWLPKHLEICTKFKVFEIFKHEIAHVISTHRNGIMDDHDEAFVTAYDEINSYFKSQGFDSLIVPHYELWGVPQSSYAARVAMSRRVGQTVSQMAMNKCPYCKEEIQNGATKCRHCGEWLQNQLLSTECVNNDLWIQNSSSELLLRNSSVVGWILLVGGLMMLFIVWPLALVLLVLAVIRLTHNPESSISPALSSLRLDANISKKTKQESCYVKAFEYQNQDRYDLAIREYTRHIKVHRNDPMPFYRRAQCYDKTGSFDLAISDYRQFLELGKGSASEKRTALAKLRIQEYDD